MKRKQQQKKLETPNKKFNVQPVVSPNSNSNSYSQIYHTYFPRTPVRKVNQYKKDQLGQIMEKGISKYAIATQVIFNSTQPIQDVLLEENTTSSFHIYDRRNKLNDSDWSLLYQKSAQSYSNKAQLFQTLTSAFNYYKSNNDSYFIISNAVFLALFTYSQQKIPYCIFMTRQENNSSQNNSPQYLNQKQIDSIILAVETPLSILFPANYIQFPTKYTLSLIKNTQIFNIFNTFLNLALEKENIDIAANFSFHNSYINHIQIYNGIDQIEQEQVNLFEEHQEYKIQYEGLFSLEQIISLKEKLQQTNSDIVVSDIKINPITTLINENLLQKIEEQLQ